MIEIENLKIGESVNLELDLKKTKETVKKLNLKRYFKFVVISTNKTLIVRVSGPNTVYSKIYKLISNGDVYAGCIVKGNVNTIKNVIHFINKNNGYSIKFKNVNGKAYIHEDITINESISLEKYKLISEAYTRKLSDLESKILME